MRYASRPLGASTSRRSTLHPFRTYGRSQPVNRMDAAEVKERQLILGRWQDISSCSLLSIDPILCCEIQSVLHFILIIVCSLAIIIPLISEPLTFMTEELFMITILL